MPMSKLTGSLVLHLAKLANLTLTEKEVQTLRAQLSEVLSYFDELKSIRTDSVEPTSQTTGLEDVLREDEIEPTRILSDYQVLSGTKNTHKGAFVVPQVIDKD